MGRLLKGINMILHNKKNKTDALTLLLRSFSSLSRSLSLHKTSTKVKNFLHYETALVSFSFLCASFLLFQEGQGRKPFASWMIPRERSNKSQASTFPLPLLLLLLPPSQHRRKKWRGVHYCNSGPSTHFSQGDPELKVQFPILVNTVPHSWQGRQPNHIHMYQQTPKKRSKTLFKLLLISCLTRKCAHMQEQNWIVISSPTGNLSNSLTPLRQNVSFWMLTKEPPSQPNTKSHLQKKGELFSTTPGCRPRQKGAIYWQFVHLFLVLLQHFMMPRQLHHMQTSVFFKNLFHLPYNQGGTLHSVIYQCPQDASLHPGFMT